MRASLVLPAYNEAQRLPHFLADLADFHRAAPATLAEIIVVDDGSTDGTGTVAARFQDQLPLRVLRLPANCGKGAAVATGVHAATGDVVIFMDADGATPARELLKMLAALRRAPIAVGNRWMRGSRVLGREPFRAFSGFLYRAYVSLFGLGGVDTMCGFKGFQREVARVLFARLEEERWLFDTEIMLRARRQGYRIENVPITWTSKHGSKLSLPALVRAACALPGLALRVSRERPQSSATFPNTG